ncbi:LOW QUALITY PROTEIN: calcineurin-binding protein cabin-1-like [Uloborus diversus]|uniref:LOW QUALITY PROTEIN: calcineurin-binding protein cabin-1-like n=1 Tax=Uloborus diversus TaxID=327109 RepID=UPI0024090F9A|nr:LOW QUALITY PROTEIN: calcineurin-binding protein cabin-1-like [Uloborus diversus]
MKFSALNESSLSDDDGDPELATREAQEEEAYASYHSALRKQSAGEVEDAESIFKELLESEFLEQVQVNEDDEEDGPLRPALTLKYLVYKNLATISSGKEDFKSATEYYLEALEIDSSDVIMWYRMGKSSINIVKYSLARLCFLEGLKCNPNHWPCLDNVITVMYTLNDYANCLYYVSKALEKECFYLKGLAFRDQIYKEDPSLKEECESYFANCDSSINFTHYDKEEAEKFIQECLDMREKSRSFYKPTPSPVLSLSLPIKEYTWKNLGDSLINMYDCVANATSSVSFSCKVDLSQYAESNKVCDSNGEKSSLSSPVSSLSEACSSNSATHLDTSQTEMEVDEVPNASSTNVSSNTYILTLPQVESQNTEVTTCNDSPTHGRRSSKRKRLLSELNDIAAKRRSTRVRNPAIKKPQDNINYQELLHKFLPSKLLGDGKFDEQDDDSDPLSQDKSNSDHTYGQSVDSEKKDSKSPPNSFDLTTTEKADVKEFVNSCISNSGVIDLLYKYVTILGSKSNFIWPKNLIEVFCNAFTRLRRHITIPNLFSHEAQSSRIKEVGMAFLVYCEFKVDQWFLSTGHSMSFSPKLPSSCSSFQSSPGNGIANDFHADMEFLVQLTARKDILDEDWINYSARALWLRAKFHSLEGEVDLAVHCMGKLSSVLCEDEETPVKITVQNCSSTNTITAENVQQQLESLQRCQSLEEVQRLYEHGDYAAVVDLLIVTFHQPRTKRKQNLEGVPERHAQLLLLQNSLLKLERYKECVYWSEVSFNEALQQFMNATKNSEWSETMAHLLSGLDNCAKLKSEYLSELEESKLVRLTQNLILVIVIQMENYDFSADNASLLVILPWIILYRLILNEEKRKAKKGSSPEKKSTIESASAGNSSNKAAAVSNFLIDFDLSASMPSSLMLLFTAHEYLGRRSWCTSADGLLLLHCLDVMLAELQDSHGESYLYKEDLETGLEQCIYCLYGHPNKRTRAKHLQEHNTKQIPLTWERAGVIFQYFKPNILPEFDSYRTSTISAELESLLKRLSTLVPSDEDPTTRVDAYTAYIEGGTDKCPDPPFKDKTPSAVVKDLYYLLGDYYFKNKEFSKAIRFYLFDICINPDRQDSWAGMALSRSSQLDQKLNSYELRNESTIYRKSSAALRCFDHALELDPTTTSLWIEYGSLAYILHSHASRQLKQDSFCDELFDLLKKKKLEMLQVAEKCFRNANHCDDGGEPEEAWLHHYMLGKICEKKGEGPTVFLDHYKKALMYLHEDFARYPQKILYHNPAELSIEALEVYYRVHASCIKFLWKHENSGFDLSTLKIIRKCLKEVSNSPFAHFQEKCKKEYTYSSSASEPDDSVVHVPLVEPTSQVDHNYYGSEVIQKFNGCGQIRHNRPSTDSSPESQDCSTIMEVIESLVGVVEAHFIDEAKEIAYLKNSSECSKTTKTDSGVVLEFVAEESVYTSKSLQGSVENSEVSSSESRELNEEKPDVEMVTIVEEKDELAKLQQLAMELETRTAALKDEEMKRKAAEANESCPMKSSEMEVNVINGKSTQENELSSNSSAVTVVQESKNEEVLNALSSILFMLEDAQKSVKDEEKTQLSQNEEKKLLIIAGDKIGDKITKTEDDLSSCHTVPMEISGEEDQTPAGENELGLSESVENNSLTNTHKNSTEKIENVIDETGIKSSMSVHECEVTSKKEIDDTAMDTSDNNSCKNGKENEIKSDDDDKTVKDPPSACSSSSSKEQTKSSDIPAINTTNTSITKTPTADELKKSQAEIMKLIPMCLDSMRECLQRFIQHYKSLYRMAHYYCHSTKNKNLQWAREILLAATPITKNYPSMPGLFADRKNTNFFNGIWRAPSNEIDRPGSFGAHMYRSVHLLIEVLTQQRDYNMLVNLTQQLYRTPELGKKYMRDTDRVYLVRKSYDCCVNILRDQMNSLLQEEPPPEESRLICCLLEIYRSCQTLLKSGIFVDETNELLEEAYTMYRIGEVDPYPSVLEQATKFCQLQLGKSYSHNVHDLSKPYSSSKYGNASDLNESNANMISSPSTSSFAPEPWQKGKRA